MKLSEIKKCKVPELRAKLKELGLDPQGLKTELIGRLWSAVEAGLQERLKSSESEQDYETTANPNPNPSSSATEMDNIDVKSTSPPISNITSSYISCSIREYADTATQTDRCSSLTSGLESSTAREEEQRATTPNSMLQEYTTPQKYPHVEDGELSCADSGHVLVDGNEVEESQSWHGEEEPSGVSTRLEKMGRAFYEFKEEIRYKRAKFTQPARQSERDVGVDRESVQIDMYASDLHFLVDPDCSGGRPRFSDRFPLLWSGCRLTHGVQSGTGSSFEVRLEEDTWATACPSGRQPGAERRQDPPGLRVGWARGDSASPLGEEELSYAYDGRGRKVSGGKEEEFGEPLSEGDIIGCYLLFSTDGAVEMSFHKNGRPMGMAFRLGPSVLRGHTLFPHVLCLGCSVRFRLDPAGGPWYPGPPGCTPLVGLPVAQRVRAPEGPSSRTECEVIMMVGLPGSGKSHWARALMEQHPDKRYRLLGTETLLASMIGEGQRERKLQQASQCLTELIKMASLKAQNYILDQPNVFVSARQHKLQLFAGHGRRVVAVVFPRTDEWRRRLALRQVQDGEQIPDTALLKLKVSYSLPEQQSQPCEELRFVELPQEEAQVLLHAYREEARRLLPPVPKPQKKARVKRNRAHHPPHSNQRKRSAENETVFHRQAWGPQPIYWNSNPAHHGFYHSPGYGYSSYHGHW